MKYLLNGTITIWVATEPSVTVVLSSCTACGMIHSGACQLVRTVTYSPDGTIAEVKLYEMAK